MSVVKDRPLHIGINILFLIPGKVGGSEIYTRQLLRDLAQSDKVNHYYVFRNIETTSAIVPCQSNFQDCPQPVHGSSRIARLLFEQTRLLFSLHYRKIEVLLNCGFTGPILSPISTITVFYDLQYKHFASNITKLELAVNSILMPLMAWRSRRIVAMSESVERDLLANFSWLKGRIVRIPHTVDSDFTHIRNLRECDPKLQKRNYILTVSSLMGHKNFDTLLHAFYQFGESHPDIDLVIAGVKGRDTERLESIRDSLGLRERVNFTGWIPRKDLLELFRFAQAFVYASKFEGFGIPVLESLTSGIPTACSDIAPLREIAGDAALYFDPNDISSVFQSLEQIMYNDNLRSRLQRDGPLRSQMFDNDKGVLNLIKSFQSISN